MSTETTPAMSAEEIAATIEFGTEYEEKRATLARRLHKIGAPRIEWGFATDATQDAYYADADAVLALMPHLLSYGERERLTPFLPALALKPEEVITGERGKVESYDPESLVCVCGNHAADEGLIPATPEGITVHLHNTPKPDALAAWPADENELHTLCRVCGRLYRDATILATNAAPVARIVDLRHGTPATAAVIAHDAEMGTP